MWKGKDGAANCEKLSPIRLVSHTLKITKRIAAQQLKEVVEKHLISADL